MIKKTIFLSLLTFSNFNQIILTNRVLAYSSYHGETLSKSSINFSQNDSMGQKNKYKIFISSNPYTSCDWDGFNPNNSVDRRWCGAVNYTSYCVRRNIFQAIRDSINCALGSKNSFNGSYGCVCTEEQFQ